MNIFHEDFEGADSNFPITIITKISDRQTTGYKLHWHEAIEFYHVVSGGVNLLVNGTPTLVTADKIALVPWCSIHKIIGYLDNTKFYVIHADLQNPLFSTVRNLYAEKYIFDDPEIVDAFKNMVKAYEQKENSYKLTVIGQLFTALGKILTSTENKNTDVNIYDKTIQSTIKVLKIINNHFNEKIKLEALSDMVGISEEHMCRMFKKNTGYSIVQYINTLRFNQAIILIREGHSVTESSEMVGFDDVCYFSRAFKKAIGKSPSAFIPRK